MIDQQEHAYPGYQMERAFLECATREHPGVLSELALGLLETTEILAQQAQDLRELARCYLQLASDVTANANAGPFGGHPQEWVDRRTALASECGRLGVDCKHGNIDKG